MSGLATVFPPPPSNYKYFTNENLEKLALWKQQQTNSEMNILSDMMSDSFHKIDETATTADDSERAKDTEESEDIKPRDTDTEMGEKDVKGGINPAKGDEASKQASNVVDAADKIGSAKDLERPEHPLDLLIPPAPPTNGTYRSFGNVWQADDKLMSLKDMGITQLYTLGNKEATDGDGNEGKMPDIQDRIFELKKLLHSVLVQFVELTGIMSISPESFPEKTEDIRVILINIHHLLNEYRPHQSRESLILLMEDELATKKKDIEDLRKTNEGIRQKIANLTNQFRVLLPTCEVDQEDSTAKEEINADGTRKQESEKPHQQNNHEEEQRRQTLDNLQWQLLESA